MSLKNKSLICAFIAMLFFTLFSYLFSPLHRLMFFAPFLILVYYQKPYAKALQYSFFAGLIIDIFSSPARFGLHALNYTLTTALIYHQRRNLFNDNLMTMPIMTYLFSSLSTVIELILLYIFLKPVAFSFSFILSDLIFMPFFDACFSFCWFVIPSLLFKRNRLRNYGQEG